MRGLWNQALVLARSVTLRSIFRTAGFNMVNTLLAGVGGILVARVLGAGGRGDYAVLISWLGLALLVGELGQTASVTYHVARFPSRARDFLATSSRTLFLSGLIAIPIGLVAAPLLADGRPARELGFKILVVALPIAFVGASYIFALQANRINWWNWVRFSQPAVWFVGLLAVLLIDDVKLSIILMVYVFSVVVQVVVAIVLCARAGLLGGRADRTLVRPLMRYGAGQLASALPAGFTRQLDVIVLATAVTSAEVGKYSVAMSYSLVAFPLASAVGSVVFPRQARAGGSGRSIVGLSVFGVLAVTAAVMVPLVLIAGWLLPVVFGAEFSGSVNLLWYLTPGLVALPVNQVGGDLLRGMGKPHVVAVASWTSLVLLAGSLYLLVPAHEAVGAAISTSIAQLGAAAVLIVALFIRKSTVTS